MWSGWAEAAWFAVQVNVDGCPHAEHVANFETVLQLWQAYLCFAPVVREVVEAEGAVGWEVLHLQGLGVLLLVLGTERPPPG